LMFFTVIKCCGDSISVKSTLDLMKFFKTIVKYSNIPPGFIPYYFLYFVYDFCEITEFINHGLLAIFLRKIRHICLAVQLRNDSFCKFENWSSVSPISR